MLSRSLLTKLLGTGFSIGALAPSPAMALDLDYYTYNGFDQTVQAFQRIALIFGDNEYLYLVGVAVILGIVFAAMSAGVKALANNGNGNTWSWALMTLFGVLIFRGLVLPTGTVHVYDPTRNAYQAVGGVPDLVVFVAGGMNLAERVVVELVDASAATPYQDTAGGINFQMLLNAMNDHSGGFEDYYLNKSIRSYYTDCSQMALIQPSYNFDLNQLKSGTTNLFALLAELRSPADFTEWYDTANKGGIPVSCEVAWDTYLQPALSTVANYGAMLNTVCQKSGFNPTDANQLARCQTLLGQQNVSVYNVAGDHIHFLRNAALATAIAAALQDENPDIGLRALTNRAVLTEGIGIAQAANEWLPTVRATVTAIVLGLFPLLIVFLVTPLAPKSLLAMFGLLSWLTFWGITDAVMHRGALDLAFQSVEEIQRHNMGLTAMMLTPEVSTKALAIFGQARGMGVMIASVLSGVLVGFSGYALSSVSQSFQRRVESAGSDAAGKSLTPEGQSDSLLSAAAGYGTALNMGNLGFEQYARGSAVSKGVEASSGEQYLEATSTLGLSTDSAISSRGAIAGGDMFGGVMSTRHQARKNGRDPSAVGDLFDAASEVTNLEQSMRFGDARGKMDAMSTLGFGDANDFSAFVSMWQTTVGATDTMTHGANIETFKDIHAQRTGTELSDGEAARLYSQMRMASITGDLNAFGADTDRAIDFMANNRQLQDHHLAGIIAGADRLGVAPEVLAENSGMMQAAMQEANRQQFGQMTIGQVASGAFTNQVMATESGLQLQNVMSRDGFMTGLSDLIGNETLMRDANAQQLTLLSNATGIPVEELALARAGANQSVAFSSNDVSGMVEGGVVSSDSARLASSGVVTTSLDSDGVPVQSSVRAGSSANIDNSERITEGTTVAGASTAAFLLTAPENEDQLENVLRATDGNFAERDALKMEMAQFLSGIQTSNVSLSHSGSADLYAEAHAGGSWLVGGAKAGVRGSVSGSVSDTTAYNVNYEAVSRTFDASYSDAKSDVNAEAQRLSQQNQTMSPEQREEMLFDRFAHHLNRDMGELIGNLKGNQQDAIRAAEDLEEVPVSQTELDAKEQKKEEDQWADRFKAL